MTNIINLTTILSILLIVAMNSFISSGSFLDNFLYHTSIHLREGGKTISQNSLDPLHFQKSLSLNDSNYRLDLSFNGFLKGYTDYDFQKMDINPDLNVSFVGTLTDTQVSGSYKMNGSYFNILPLNGDGIYLFTLKNVSLALDTKIQPKNARLQIPNFDMDYNFDGIEISLWGLTGDQGVGDILQEFMKDLIEVVLRKKKNTITKQLKTYVLEEGNAKLKNMTLANMIEIMKDIFVY